MGASPRLDFVKSFDSDSDLIGMLQQYRSKARVPASVLYDCRVDYIICTNGLNTLGGSTENTKERELEEEQSSLGAPGEVLGVERSSYGSPGG